MIYEETEKPRIGSNQLHGMIAFWGGIQSFVPAPCDREAALLQKTTHKLGLYKQLGKIIKRQLPYRNHHSHFYLLFATLWQKASLQEIIAVRLY